MPDVRSLPIRVPLLAGEAIDSWLEALAARHRVCWGDMLDAVGLAQPASATTGWIACPTPQEVATLAATTGVDPDTVKAAALARYQVRALRIDPSTRTLDKTFPWSPPSCSRFCPQCLAETGGRWQLVWRLGWSFACLRHHRLLADTCPACQQRQRRRPLAGIAVPAPAHCASPLPGSVGRAPARCGADLTEAETLLLGAGHPSLDAQQTIYDIIDTGVAEFGVYAALPQLAQAALTDVRVIAHRVLTHATTAPLAGAVPDSLFATCSQVSARTRSRNPSRAAPATTAVAAGIAVTAAVAVLGASDAHRGGDALRWLIDAARANGTKTNATVMGRAPASPVLDGIQLAALAPSMGPADQLRYRIADTMPRRPETTTARASRLVRSLPTMLWPQWSLRLAVPGPQQRQLRPAVSAALLLTGTNLPLEKACTLLGGLVESHQVIRILGLLADSNQWQALRQALTLMADHLTNNSAPIDYQRRRHLDYTDLLPDTTWQRICRGMGTPAISTLATAKRVRCFLFERLSGLPADTSPAAIDTCHFRIRTADLVRHLTPELTHALREHAREFLAARGIHDEPPTWKPPTHLLDGLPLPADDPARLDTDRLHRLIRHEGRSLGEAAQILGTTRDTVRHLLEIRPAPATTRPTKNTAYLTAKTALPPDKLAELYLRQRINTADIAEQVSVPDKVIARLARDYGIPLRKPGQQITTSIDPDWLHEQYITLGRPLTDLARQTGTSWSTMASWAHRHNIPLRRRAHNAQPQEVPSHRD